MASARQIHVGGVPIGGGAPVVVQSMTKTETADVQAVDSNFAIPERVLEAVAG